MAEPVKPNVDVLSPVVDVEGKDEVKGNTDDDDPIEVAVVVVEDAEEDEGVDNPVPTRPVPMVVPLPLLLFFPLF